MEKVNGKQPSSSSFDIAECHDTTESSSSFSDSSSFGDTDSEPENADNLDYSEALSEFHGDIGFIKKKKLTDHWRSYIQPLMWRCKWAELQIRKLESQAKKYDMKLKKCERQKQIQLEDSTSEENGMRSVPSSWNSSRKNVLRRHKRRRIEDTTNLSEYMSNHNLFSLFENRKEVTKGVLKVNEINNQEKCPMKVRFEDEFWESRESRESDEVSCPDNRTDDDRLEPIFRKIDLLQSQVVNLKSKVHEILTEKAEILSCIDNSNMPMSCDDDLVDSDSPQNSDSPSNSRDTMTICSELATQLLSELIASKLDHVEDDVLIDNHMVRAMMSNLADLTILPTIQRSPMARPTRIMKDTDLAQ